MPRATRYALAVIASVYGAVACLGYLGKDSLVLWLLSLPLIGGLQNHLLILHHEGAHGLLHPGRSKNDFLANVFCGYPFFELMGPYREFHFAHHRYVTDPARDPEIPFYAAQGYYFRPRSRIELIYHAALDLSGYHWLQFFIAFLLTVNPRKAIHRRELGHLGAFLGILLALIALGGENFLIHSWLIPQVTFTFFFAKARGIREHNRRQGSVADCTNDWPAEWIARFFYCPLNSHRHRYHHLHPGVCWFAYPT